MPTSVDRPPSKKTVKNSITHIDYLLDIANDYDGQFFGNPVEKIRSVDVSQLGAHGQERPRRFREGPYISKVP